MDRELFPPPPRQTQGMAEYDAPVACIQARFRYGYTLGRSGYLALRPVHAALSTTVHSSGLIPNRR